MDTEKKRNSSWAERFATLQLIVQNITLEPVVALNALANSMQSTVLQSLAMTKFCLNDFNQTIGNCTNVTDPSLRQSLSGSTAYYQFYRQSLELGPCILIALFLGTWSDKYGRKLLILIPLTGDTLSCVNYTLQSYFINAKVYYLLFGSTIQGITGGDIIFNMATQSFVMELSTARTRTLRIGMVEVAFLFGAPIGSIMGGLLYERYGYVTVFFVAFVSNSMALVYALIRLRKIPFINKIDKGRPFRDMFRTDNIKHSAQVFTQKREGRKRLYVCLTALSLWLLMFPRYGNLSIHYLYTHVKFNYTVAQFSMLMTALIFSVGIGDLIIVPVLSYVLKLKDASLGTIATIICIGGELLYAFSINPMMMYLACIPLLFLGTAGIAGRSLLSKCVDNNELGRLLSLLGCIYAFGPIVAGLLYAKIFNETMKTFIGACYVISAGINMFSVLIYGWILFDWHRTTKNKANDGEKVEKSETTNANSNGKHVDEVIETTFL